MQPWRIIRKHALLTLVLLLPLTGGAALAQTLTMAMAAQPDTLDPQVTAATAAFQVSKSIYDTLIEVDRAGNLVPALAASYAVSPDGLTYTFELVEATFHDGTALDAADVVATLDRIRAEETASPKRVEFQGIVSVAAQSDRTVVVTLSEPQPALLSSLASGWGAILPSEKLAEGHDFGNQPVGTGPFSFVGWTRDNAITLAANPDYYQGAPQVEQVVIRFVTDSAVQLQGLLTGEFDVVDTVAAADQPVVEANPSLTLVREPSGLVLVAGINTRREYLSDARVRQALNLGVDTAIVMEVAYNGGSQVGTFMEAGSPWYPESVQPFAYDLETARALLREAGVPQGYTLDLVLPQPYEAHIQAGQIVQDYLRDLGLDARIRIVEWGVWLSDTYGGPRNFDITVVGHTGKLDPSGRLTGLGDPRTNYTGLDDPKLVGLIATANITPDHAARQALYTEALERIHEAAPFIFFGTPDRVYARQTNVAGFWMTPLLDSYDFREARFE
ncbi:MAG: ABC transporter substrate-binding protein [Trueperaceae bacterium]